jgi:hypothetical protein
MSWVMTMAAFLAAATSAVIELGPAGTVLGRAQVPPERLQLAVAEVVAVGVAQQHEVMFPRRGRPRR